MTMTLRGRRKIYTQYTSEDLLSADKLALMFNSAKKVHDMNKTEIDYLLNYYKGAQPILEKEKVVRDEINNITVINHAQMITRTIVAYFLGNPIQYISSKDGNKESVNKLNDYVSYENKPTVDKEIGDYQSITGLGYRIVYSDIEVDEVPFEDRCLSPETTFVVYENTISEKPVAGVTYYALLDEKGYANGIRVYIYTDFGVYDVTTDQSGQINARSTISFNPYNVGGVPIIEYPNNRWRMGDWEFVTGLMEDINSLQSGRMDDIEQIVESLLVFTNADIDADTYDEMRERGVVMLKNMSGNQSKVEVIKNPLDQTGINIFAKELQELLYSLVGIPSRDNRAGGGGDTGQAVELRDGWADLEIVARNKELVFKKSEKQALKIILSIINNTENMDLALKDIDIKFTRNKNHNLLVKTQSYQTLLATETLSPEDALTVVDLVSDPNEYIARGKDYWDTKKEEMLKTQQDMMAQQPTEPQINDTSNNL